MKIYTKTGDAGETGLIGGARVAKADLRVEAYGTVDELNALLGLVAAMTEVSVRERIQAVQARLFDVGSLLATPPDTALARGVQRVDPAWILHLESEIDEMEEIVPPLRTFILPGGTEPAAMLHLARTVCRRAERRVVAMPRDMLWDGNTTIAWLNRLSDWIFVLARFMNHTHGVIDVPWAPPSSEPSTD